MQKVKLKLNPAELSGLNDILIGYTEELAGVRKNKAHLMCGHLLKELALSVQQSILRIHSAEFLPKECKVKVSNAQAAALVYAYTTLPMPATTDRYNVNSMIRIVAVLDKA